MYPEANDCALCWGDSPCSDECLKAQLEEAYKDCGDDFTAKLITGNRGGTNVGESDE